MKTYFFIVVIVLLSALSGFAQRNKKSSELGIFIGASYYIGSLNPNGNLNQFTKPAGGVVFRYNFNPRLSFRVNGLYGNIGADDAYSSSAWQRQRNLNFKSQITELSTQLEFNFVNYQIGGKEEQNFAPYIFAGLGLFHFDPQGEIDGTWVALQPLSTEGEGLPGGPKEYKLTQISIPMGIGVKANFSKNVGISFEWGMRKTFTGYLDDVSGVYYDPAKLTAAKGLLAAEMSDRTVGIDPKSNIGKERGNNSTDWYSFLGVVLTVKLNDAPKKCPASY